MLFICFFIYFSANKDYQHDDVSNLTAEDDRQEDFMWFMQAQTFTLGTLLGLLVASIVVVIGSFLVLWRLCCEVEMVVTREVIEPLQSISQNVSSKPSTNRSVTNEKLLGQSCSSSVFEISWGLWLWKYISLQHAIINCLSQIFENKSMDKLLTWHRASTSLKNCFLCML